MSQTPHPHDPFGNEPSADVPEQPAASNPYSEDQASPTSDPALHPHDPFAASTQPAGASAPSAGSAASAAPGPYGPGSAGPQWSAAEPSAASPYGAPAPSADGGNAQDPYAAAAGAGPGQHGGYAQQGAYGQQQAPQAGPQSTDVPPPGTKGVFEGQLSGPGLNDSDTRMWAMFSQLAVTLGHVVSWGFLGWVGPLIIFLVYKDRSRFVRFHAAEALNGAITVAIATVVLWVAIGIFGVLTFTVGWALFPLAGIPVLIQLVFSILGAVKANQGQWWSYPFNLRLVK
ncbi:DUF4870 domain-containing protein [Brachybacterium tyrofermentans]|uniref:DUF4870 domain-containing protein n=1 Tax=Brachybacterium tyrofermentans TaxID=47848 RepID=A0ABW0FJ38_9MICO